MQPGFRLGKRFFAALMHDPSRGRHAGGLRRSKSGVLPPAVGVRTDTDSCMSGNFVSVTRGDPRLIDGVASCFLALNAIKTISRTYFGYKQIGLSYSGHKIADCIISKFQF